MSTHQSIRFEALVPSLEKCGSNVYSQFGEDGLIARTLELIGVQNRWCFEVGAADGEFFSNTLRLREIGWTAVLMESDPKACGRLRLYESESVHCVYETVVDLDEVLSRYDTPMSPDLGVIDIDGQDYWLWRDMQLYRPRIVLIEYGRNIPATHIPARGAPTLDQAGAMAITALGLEKGYRPVARTFVNLLMVQEEDVKFML